MHARFARLSLLVKILLSTSCAITLLFAITTAIVLRNIRHTMSDSLKEEVRGSFQAYTSLWKSRQELLAAASRMVSGMKEVRTAIRSGDRTTIEDSAGELWAKVSREDALFLVADPAGKVLASLGGVTSPAFSKDLEIARTAAAGFPAHIDDSLQVAGLEASGFFFKNADPCELYQVTITPVYSGDAHGQTLRRLVVAGYKVDELVARELKDATGSDFLFETAEGAIASTLHPAATAMARASLARVGNTDLASDGIHKYAWYRTPLLDISGRKVAEICILRSFEDAERRIAGLSSTILVLWLGAMGAGLGLTYLLARRIVEPVEQLDRAAAEVARQNYAIEVEVHGEDEMGRLARTFNAMCASIREGREELIRQERISTIGRLSGSIVHDLRNPLAAIYGGAEMLVDADLPPAHVKRLAANIYRASRRIQELLQDLLDVSRGKTTAAEPCRLREVAAAACESLAASAEAQNVSLALDIAPEIELPLERSRMERAFVNLIGNAIEAMPEGGAVRITAQFDSGAVLVHVDDSGPGVAPEILARLFQPFVTAGKRNGLGLGLALTRQTVLEQGGDLSVGSAPLGGARFTVRLPGALG